MNEEPNNFVEAPKELGQGVFNKMSLPLNQDFVAVSRAVSDLLKEGWEFSGFERQVEDCFHITLTRTWRA